MHRTKVGPVYGHLAKGCKLCGKGAKLVLFATGKCPFNCFYCPISQERRGKELIFANERPVENLLDIIEEANAMRALGAGITGGDPLASDKTFEIIEFVKENLGSNFHVHLYTRINEPEKLKRAYYAGVDEIRFHFTDPRPAFEFSWDVGAEIPVIPGWERAIKNYLLFLSKIGVKFVNLNELEFSESNFLEMRRRGFKPRGEIDYGVKGSEELALKLLRWAEDISLPLSIHYCSAKTKIEVQLKERYKRTARNIAKRYEIVTDEGTIIVGVVKRSREIENKLKKMKCPYEIAGDEIKTSPACLKMIGRGKIVEYWPTFDRKPVEITPL